MQLSSVALCFDYHWICCCYTLGYAISSHLDTLYLLFISSGLCFPVGSYLPDIAAFYVIFIRYIHIYPKWSIYWSNVYIVSYIQHILDIVINFTCFCISSVFILFLYWYIYCYYILYNVRYLGLVCFLIVLSIYVTVISIVYPPAVIRGFTFFIDFIIWQRYLRWSMLVLCSLYFGLCLIYYFKSCCCIFIWSSVSLFILLFA
jgi:hypothetical protein